MKEKTNIIIDYLERLKEKPIGASDYSILIEMINEEEKIIDVEIMEKYKYNLLSFLDGGVVALLQNKNNKKDFYNSVVTVLTTWNKLPNKWDINGYDFKKLFEKNIF